MDDPIRASGPDLAGVLRARMHGDGPLYRLLADALKGAIDRGEIALGTVLPPERALAGALAVSRATVVAAYDRLKSEGWLESRQGSGTWVRRPEDEDHDGVDAIATGRVFLPVGNSRQRTDPSDHSTPTDSEDLVELSVAAVTGAPQITEVVCSLEPEEISRLTAHHGYVPQGLRSLRKAIVARYAADGLPTSEEQVIITTGAHQALSLIARQVLHAGDSVLVESPTFPGALDVFRRFGARAIPVPVDEHGARTDLVADLIARTEPSMIYVAPHFHNPTGAVMPRERRIELGKLAADTDTVIVEDLALADVAIDDVDLPPPIAALAPDATVHTIGSTAKVLWAGLRIGWLRAPAAWSVRMLATKTVADIGSPILSQYVALKLLQRYDEIRADRRNELRVQRDAMCAALAEHLPDWSWRSPAGGLSLWVRLPYGNADEFAEIALHHGVVVVPGPALSVDEGNRRSLRLVFARPVDQIDEGVRRLAAAWSGYAPAGPNRPAARLLV